MIELGSIDVMRLDRTLGQSRPVACASSCMSMRTSLEEGIKLHRLARNSRTVFDRGWPPARGGGGRTEVIRRMRALLKKTPFEQKQFDLNEVVQETIRFFSALAISHKFQLVNVITPDPLPIIGDRIQLQQVILNLVMNGIDAMKDTANENRIITIKTSAVENFAELSVSDRGSGIPEDKLEEVFEPFFTTKGEGMGMGLSIARTIIETHHGMISTKNRDHGGATFRISLPLVH